MDTLLNILRDRATGLDEDDVRWAFDSPKTRAEITAWVEEYLNSSTTLTQSELEIYESLPKTGPANELSSSCPVFDDELISAVKALETSTAEIDRQCTELDIQKKALSKLSAANRSVEQTRREADSKRRREIAQEVDRLNLDVDELGATVTTHLRAIEQQANDADSSTQGFINATFKSDDSLLAALERVAAQSQPVKNDQKVSEDVTQLCKALVAFRSEDVKARISKTYTDELHRAFGGKSGITVDQENTNPIDLKEELDTLYEEIASVAEMVVDHELRKPIHQQLDAARIQQMRSQNQSLSYALDSVNYLTARLDAINTHTSDVHHFGRAVRDVRSLATAELSGTSERRDLSSTNSAVNDPSTGPLVSVNLERCLRHLDISTESSLKAVQDLRAALSTALGVRRSKSQEHSFAADTGTIRSLAASIAKADDDTQSIAQAIYAHTLYTNVNLSDASLDTQSLLVENAIARLKEDIDALNE